MESALVPLQACGIMSMEASAPFHVDKGLPATSRDSRPTPEDSRRTLWRVTERALRGVSDQHLRRDFLHSCLVTWISESLRRYHETLPCHCRGLSQEDASAVFQDLWENAIPASFIDGLVLAGGSSAYLAQAVSQVYGRLGTPPKERERAEATPSATGTYGNTKGIGGFTMRTGEVTTPPSKRPRGAALGDTPECSPVDVTTSPTWPRGDAVVILSDSEDEDELPRKTDVTTTDTCHAGVSPDRPEPRAVEKGTLNDVSSMLAALTDVILKQRGLRDGCLKEIQDSSLPSLENGLEMVVPRRSELEVVPWHWLRTFAAWPRARPHGHHRL